MTVYTSFNVLAIDGENAQKQTKRVVAVTSSLPKLVERATPNIQISSHIASWAGDLRRDYRALAQALDKLAKVAAETAAGLREKTRCDGGW